MWINPPQNNSYGAEMPLHKMLLIMSIYYITYGAEMPLHKILFIMFTYYVTYGAEMPLHKVLLIMFIYDVNKCGVWITPHKIYKTIYI